MLEKIKTKIKKNTEIIALGLLIIVTITSTTFYNHNKNNDSEYGFTILGKYKDFKETVHLEQGDTLWMDDKDFYHALTPITQGVRVTAISRWGNQTPDRGFDY